ncbi:hypothetical protein E8L99_09085 [Phreatobacter aquaticus]|uniref:Uncharacterized protein n=1 Tax=Phreatobacter aquaticus TaxID=2570229 RepID=A0A4D7QJ44_9HYPH|nr:hypothetical protein [Phreatobacter aquaticus]QCK85903.1 hypothetical protein E8L99_09085 [Phreatobacter aquaticus]
MAIQKTLKASNPRRLDRHEGQLWTYKKSKNEDPEWLLLSPVRRSAIDEPESVLGLVSLSSPWSSIWPSWPTGSSIPESSRRTQMAKSAQKLCGLRSNVTCVGFENTGRVSSDA